MQRVTRVLTALAIATAVIACSSTDAAAPSAPSVDQAAATAIADEALEALNAGDYDRWSAHWSADLKAAIKEQDFRAVRDQVLAQRGAYVALGTPVLSSATPGTFRWTFPVTFEKGSASFWIGFRDGTTQVAGLRLE